MPSKLQEKYAEKNRQNRAKGKETTSKDLPKGSVRNTGKKIEQRRKTLENI